MCLQCFGYVVVVMHLLGFCIDFAMFFLCVCNVFAMFLLCVCYVFAMFLLCFCYAFALCLICFCYSFAMRLLSRADGTPPTAGPAVTMTPVALPASTRYRGQPQALTRMTTSCNFQVL